MKASTPELLKFQKLMRRLKESRRGIIGLLEGLWLATAKNCPQGDIGRFSNEDIAIMVDWEGDADELVAALVECRWLDVCSENRLLVHDWEDHCPTYVKGNLKKSEREILTPTSASQEAPKEPPKDTPKEPPSVAPMDMPTYPNLTIPNQVNSIQDSCSEPQADFKPKRVDEPLYDLEFKTTGKQSTWKPTQALVDRLIDTYETIDVIYQLKAASMWCETNPRKRKTADGMGRMLDNWMKTAVNNPRSPKRQPPPRDGEFVF